MLWLTKCQRPKSLPGMKSPRTLTDLTLAAATTRKW
jgi:hypothetical protein